MKRVLFILLIFIGTTYSVSAQNDTTRNIPFTKAIEILGFEKTLTSKNESLMIKNNTPELVTRVKLRLTYKTPQNEMLDYKEITLDGEILSGMTKKFTFDSFDENKQYYYINNVPQGKAIESSYPFKVTATLLRYDIAIMPEK